MRRLAPFAAVLLLAGCGGGNEKIGTAEAITAPATTAAQPVTTEAESAETAPARATSVLVYFLRDGRIAAAQREIRATHAVARAALEALAAGPNAAERAAGYKTSVPRELELDRLSVADGTARVDFTGEKGCPSIAQIVYTLTQFPTVQRVAGNCIPAPAYGAGLTRADLENLTPPILVESPTVGQKVRSPLRITGSANTFEATFVVEVVDRAERTLAEQVVTATSGSGDRGTFAAAVSFEVDAPGDGTLLAYERSAEDGSQLHLVEIPIRLTP
jgi:germination protein M